MTLRGFLLLVLPCVLSKNSQLNSSTFLFLSLKQLGFWCTGSFGRAHQALEACQEQSTQAGRPSARFEQARQSSTAAILTKARGLELGFSRAELGDFGSAVADKSLIPCKSHTQAAVQYHPLVGRTPATTRGQHSEVTHGGHHPGSLLYSQASECQ